MATKAVRRLAEPTQAERAMIFERWIDKVDAKDRRNPKACWRWRGAKSQKRNGKRGVLRVGGRSGRILSAARVGKILATGEKFNSPAIADLEICHIKCRNGGNVVDCVNPRHTEWGTREENEQHKKRIAKAHAARQVAAVVRRANASRTK